MTPMSDVMVLLLTFFMLTATFVKEEPIQVQTPGSVSEIKIPEKKCTQYANQKTHYITADQHPDLRPLSEEHDTAEHDQHFCYCTTYDRNNPRI